MLYGIRFQDDRRPAGVDPARISFAEGPHLRRYEIVERGAVPAVLDQQIMTMRERLQPLRKAHLILPTSPAYCAVWLATAMTTARKFLVRCESSSMMKRMCSSRRLCSLISM